MIVAADPFVGAGSARGACSRPFRVPVVVEVHGDWRTFTRRYGSPARRSIALAATDRLPAFACVARTRRGRCPASPRASSRRSRGRPARRLSSRPTATSAAFTAEPVAELPERPTALFVGMLEAYKNIDGMAAAWRRVAVEHARRSAHRRRKGRTSTWSSTGSSPDLPEHVEHVPELGRRGVATRSTVRRCSSCRRGLRDSDGS